MENLFAKKKGPPDEIEDIADKCKDCQKLTFTTTNPKAQMGLCRWNGVMVMKEAASCGVFRRKNKPV